MTIWWLVSLFAFSYASNAPQSGNTAWTGPADLISFTLGNPLSAEQTDEREHVVGGGGLATQSTKSWIYRDAAGRLRIEIVSPQPEEYPDVFLLDPGSGYKVVLSRSERIAYRVTGPKGGENGFAYGVGGLGEGLPSGAWTTSTEQLGRRIIDGIEADGTRITQTSAHQPSLRAVYERWYSADLKLIFLAIASGPGWKHTARIHILRRQEPDGSLFVPPRDYTIQNVEIPGTP